MELLTSLCFCEGCGNFEQNRDEFDVERQKRSKLAEILRADISGKLAACLPSGEQSLHAEGADWWEGITAFFFAPFGSECRLRRHCMFAKHCCQLQWQRAHLNDAGKSQTERRHLKPTSFRRVSDAIARVQFVVSEWVSFNGKEAHLNNAPISEHHLRRQHVDHSKTPSPVRQADKVGINDL